MVLWLLDYGHGFTIKQFIWMHYWLLRFASFLILCILKNIMLTYISQNWCHFYIPTPLNSTQTSNDSQSHISRSPTSYVPNTPHIDNFSSSTHTLNTHSPSPSSYWTHIHHHNFYITRTITITKTNNNSHKNFKVPNKTTWLPSFKVTNKITHYIPLVKHNS